MPTLTCNCGNGAVPFACGALAWTVTHIGNNASEHTATVQAVCPTCNQAMQVTFEIWEEPIGTIDHMEATTMNCSFDEYCVPALPAPPAPPMFPQDA